MSAIDFLLDENNDLLEGDDYDIVEGDSDRQHIQDILQLEPGELKYDPLMGVGIERYMNGLADGSLNKNIYLQLQADKYNVKEMQIDENGNIGINAQREGQI